PPHAHPPPAPPAPAPARGSRPPGAASRAARRPGATTRAATAAGAVIATGNTRVATASRSGPGDVAAAITRLWCGRPIEAAGAVTPAHRRRSHRASQDHPLGNPLPRPDAPERRVRPGRVLEVQPAAGEAPGVHEGPVPEGAIDERTIHVHVRAVEERVVEERTVERRRAKERDVEKR